MYYIIYKTINLINNKFYIGKHQCTDLNDGYLGSGIALRKAIAKYGKKNFKREILFIFDSEIDINNKEKEIVTIDLVNDPNCYNLTIGGEGGLINPGYHHSTEVRLRLSEIAKKRKPHKRTEAQQIKQRESRYAKNNGKWFSDSTIEKIRQRKVEYYKNKTKKSAKEILPKKSREEINKQVSDKLKGHTVSEATRKKISDNRKGKKPSNKGKIQINDGYKNRYILPEELSQYLAEGWSRGKYQRNKNDTDSN